MTLRPPGREGTKMIEDGKFYKKKSRRKDEPRLTSVKSRSYHCQGIGRYEVRVQKIRLIKREPVLL